VEQRSHIDLGDIHVDVVRKDIKHVHLSVYPPDGNVRISAPLHMAPDVIRVYAITRLDWIRQQQRKLLSQERDSDRTSGCCRASGPPGLRTVNQTSAGSYHRAPYIARPCWH